MEPHEIQALVHRFSGADETHLVIATVEAYTPQGRVRVEVYDMGGYSDHRFSASVFDGESGAHLTTGNSSATIEDALVAVHWP